MEKTKRNWLITGIIAVAMIFSCMLGLGLNSQVQTAYAYYTTEDFVEFYSNPIPADEKNGTIYWKTGYDVDYYTVGYYYFNYESDNYGWQEQVVVNYTGPTIPAGTLMSYTANIDDLYAQYGDWFTYNSEIYEDNCYHCAIDFTIRCGTNAKDAYNRDVHCSQNRMEIDWKKSDHSVPVYFINEPQDANVQVNSPYTVSWSWGMDICEYTVTVKDENNLTVASYEYWHTKTIDHEEVYNENWKRILAGQEITYALAPQTSAKTLTFIVSATSWELRTEKICSFYYSFPRYEFIGSCSITWQDGEVKSTVSFNANGGSGEMLTENNVSGTYELPECTFTPPAGKQFAGWALSSSGAILNNTIEVNQNTTLYAIWEDVPVEKYTVSFNSNGGSGTMANVTEVAGVYELPENGFTAPDGKVFSGWAFSANGDTIPTEKVQITADTTLFAIWVTPAVTIQPLSGVTKIGEQYTISWSANFTVTAWQIWKMQSSDNSNHYDWKAGGMVDARPEIIIAPGTVNMYSLSQPAGITSQPYQIDIYYKDANNVEQTIYSDKFVVDWVGPNISEVVLTSNVPEILVDVDVPENVTAQTTTEHLTVSGTAFCFWDADKEQWRQYPGDKIVGGVQYGLSIALNIEEGSMLTDDVAIVFNGNDVTSTGHTDITTYNNTAYVIVLLGDPTATYTVSFNNNGGAGEMDAISGVLGEYTLPTTCPFEKIDHHFVGWALSANGEKITTATINVTENTELFAVWAEDVEPEYNLTVVDGEESTITQQVGVSVMLHAVGKIGHTFVRWTSDDVEIANATNADIEFVMPSKDVRVVAVYQAITYTISFNANGGSGTMAAVTTAYGNYELPACAFTAPDGKEFDGWALSSSGAKITTTEINVTENIQLFAVWKNVEVNPDPEPEVEPQPEPEAQPAGLGAGAIAGIVIASLIVASVGGFALVWFVIKKKKWADFVALFKKK